jgi:glycosyltransferase involved in cell wall biosynthesis
MLQACRFIEKKGLDVTLGAVQRLLQAERDVVLDLAGGGRDEQTLRTIAADLGISERVRFLGFLDNPTLLRALPDYDVFVHPSRTTLSGDREGIPNSLLEAMANGVPVVATRHSGIPEAVVDTKNGLLIDRADPEALARAVEKLLDHPELYANVSRAAHDTIAARFSISACARALEASYWEAMTLAQARSAGPPRLQHVA